MSDRQVLALSNTAPARYAVDAAGAPSVPTDWRHQFDNQARDVMAATDREIVDAHSRIIDLAGAASEYGTLSTGHRRREAEVSDTPAAVSPRRLRRTFAPGSPERSPTLDDPILDGGAYRAVPVAADPVGPVPDGGGSSAPPGGGQVPWVMTPSGPAMAPGGVIGERPPASARFVRRGTRGQSCR